LDFSIIPHFTAEELRISINKELKLIAASYGIVINENIPEETLKALVRELAKKNKVVILVDEYDKPILDHINNLEQADSQRTVLKSFYDALKGLDKYIRAVFVTGVSRFSKTSLFSGMNNLDDITLDAKAAQLLGYTEKEIEKYFIPYLEDFAQEKNESVRELMVDLKKWYNGYRFSERDACVYNPFSLLYSLSKKKFENYWYQSGTPTFLIHLIKNQYNSIENINKTELSSDWLGNFELTNIPLIPLLLQTGYLTIADYDEKANKFKLNYPNYEVELSFTSLRLSGPFLLRQGYEGQARPALRSIFAE